MEAWTITLSADCYCRNFHGRYLGVVEVMSRTSTKMKENLLLLWYFEKKKKLQKTRQSRTRHKGNQKKPRNRLLKHFSNIAKKSFHFPLQVFLYWLSNIAFFAFKFCQSRRTISCDHFTSSKDSALQGRKLILQIIEDKLYNWVLFKINTIVV